MLDVVASPGGKSIRFSPNLKAILLIYSDPLFMHHTNLDRLWWNWQVMDLPARLENICRRNKPNKEYVSTFGIREITADWVGYNGDNGGNVTTLNHVLSVLELVPNATVAGDMDLRGGSLLS